MPPKKKHKADVICDDLAPLFPAAVLPADAVEPKGKPTAKSLGSQMELAPHEHLVSLRENVDGHICLYHSRTMELKPVPHGQWDVVFDEQGYAALIRAEDDEGDGGCAFIVCEDFLTRRLYRTVP